MHRRRRRRQPPADQRNRPRYTRRVPAASKEPERFTYADVLRRPESERWEAHEGVAVSMSPAPATIHQRVVGELYRQIANFLVERPCQVFVAPFDVRLAPIDATPEQVHTVVQPDITVICNDAGLDERGFQGSPDWVIEVLSPATSARDQITKLRLYENGGVKHYWLVHPTEHVVTVYSRNDPTERFGRPRVSETKGQLGSGLFEQLSINWDIVRSRVPSDG
jgi:Uma2 family endonuclease